MRLSSCENPRRIYNSYIREYQSVPCGHCNTCRQRKQNIWVSRLEQERSCWKYTLFFTLTYSEEFVPYLELDTCSGFPCFTGVHSDFCITPEDVSMLDSDSVNYLFGLGKLRILNSKHLQNFIKRFRYHVSEKTKNSLDFRNGLFRYYVIGEYGETTLRPHYHGLIFTNSRIIFDNFEDLLTRSWSVYDRTSSVYRPFGRTDWSVVVSSAASYCAQYLNCSYHLPKVLADFKVRPFSLQSRRPPIGSLLQSDAQIQKIFHNGITRISIPTKERTPVISFLPSYLQDRLFPKCPRFSKIVHSLRVSAYGICGRLSFEEENIFGYEEKTFEEKARFFLKRLKENLAEEGLYNYLCEVTCDFVDVNAFIRLLYISRRVMSQCAIFNVSLEYYVSRIELYYDNVSKEKLRQWFDFQVEYLKSHAYTDVLSVDFDFVEKYVNGSLDLEKYYLDELSSLSDLSALDYRCTDDYKEMSFNSLRKYKETSKTKKKNDYLLAHPEKAIFVYE